MENVRENGVWSGFLVRAKLSKITHVANIFEVIKKMGQGDFYNDWYWTITNSKVFYLLEKSM